MSSPSLKAKSFPYQRFQLPYRSSISMWKGNEHLSL